MLYCNLTISRSNFLKLLSDLENKLPEFSFFDSISASLPKRSRFGFLQGTPRQESYAEIPLFLNIDELSWFGVGSYNSYKEILLDKVVPLLEGQADIVYLIDGGAKIVGLKIDNGKYFECEVTFILHKNTGIK